MPEGLMTNRSAPGTRPDTLPPVQMTRPQRMSSLWRRATPSRCRSIAASISGEKLVTWEPRRSSSDIDVNGHMDRAHPMRELPGTVNFGRAVGGVSGALPRRRGGRPQDELRRDRAAVALSLVQPAEEEGDAPPAQLREVLADGGEGRREVARLRHIVEADHTEVPRALEPGIAD